MSQKRPKFTFTRRGLLVRDSLTFLVLSLVTIVLYGVTLFLFRSFESHREDLAKRWSERGSHALQTGHPAQAIYSLRAALSYAPDDRSYQLMLAQALAGAGRTEEATNYFLNLWETRPGDGFINLQLARLARRKGDAQEAIEYYRASIFGDWQGTGLTRRREVRLELADYLTERHDLSAARAELLIGAGNAPDVPQLNLLFGDKLLATGDLPDALTFYRRAIADNPHDQVPLEKAARVAYSLGDYPAAHSLMKRALAEKTPASGHTPDVELAELERNSEQLMQLNLSRELPARERGQHLHLASTVALARLTHCSAQLSASSSSKNPPAPVSAAPETGVPAAATLPPALLDLRERWKLAGTPVNRHAVLSDGDVQDDVAQLVFDTERQTAQFCGTPTGDDALLLQLASSPVSSADSQPPEERPEQ